MKQYELIFNFGCSFTYGDGLDNKEYHRYLNKKIFNEAYLNAYREHHSYPGYLARKFNCKHVNFGEKAASNHAILKKVYLECKDLSESVVDKILIIVQTSILSRRTIYSLSFNSEHRVNSHVNNLDPNIDTYYEYFIKYFYDRKYEYKELLIQVDLLQTWLKTKKLDFLFFEWDTVEEIPNDFCYKFNNSNGSLNDFSEKNKLRICDLPNIPFVDHHLTEHGNELIAEKLYNYINKND